MRYFVTPNLSNKVVGQPAETIQLMSSAIRIIELSDKTKLMSEGLFGIPPLALENDIFMFFSQTKDFCIYATFGNDQNGEYILLLDFTLHQKDPSVSIVPTYRNPCINSMYNPKFNSAINPKFNSAINPRFNSAINPRWNSSYGGPFIYSRELQQEAFIVRANDTVELIFNLENEFTSICVKANQEVFDLFDITNEWIGFLVTSNNEVRLRFDLHNEWTGIVV